MKCKNCGHENPKDSSFCEKCGEKFEIKQERVYEGEGVGVSKGRVAELDEVLFVPKKKGGSGWWAVLGVLFVLGAIAIIYLISLGNSSSTDTTTSGANAEPTTAPEDTAFPLSYLTIENLGSEWGGANNNVFYLSGTLKNTYTKSAKNVEIRVDFYKDKAQQNLLDTRYVTVAGVSYNGAYTFNEEVSTFNFKNQQFWYTASIVSAEPY